MGIPVAPYPPAAVRKGMPSSQWTVILTTYCALLTHHLSLPPSDFKSTTKSDSRLHAFLAAYIQELSAASPSTAAQNPSETTLRKLAFKLIYRLLSPPEDEANTSSPPPPPKDLLTGPFLLALANAYPKSTALRSLFTSLTASYSDILTTALTALKTQTILPTITPPPPSQTRATTSEFNIITAQDTLRRISILILLLPYAGETFLAGSDFLEALADLYERYTASRTVVLRAAYSAFAGVLRVSQKRNYSLVQDTLYEWTAAASGSHKHAFLTALVSETALLRRLRTARDELYDDASEDASKKQTRLSSLISDLEKYTPRADGRVRRPLVRKKLKAKGKGKGKGKDTGSSFNEDEAIAQVSEVLPTLHPKIIRDTLRLFDGDVEKVIQSFLEGGGAVPGGGSNEEKERKKHWPSLQPSTTTTTTNKPPPKWVSARKNVYDDVPLTVTPTTRATVTPSLHIGKKPAQDADQLLASDTTLPKSTHDEKKLAIYAALSTILYNPDDDERDDTYDISDVGGAIDSNSGQPDSGAGVGHHQQQGGQVQQQQQQQGVTKEEEYLYKLYTTTPSVFSRDAETRRGKVREEMKRVTGWGDERIEGWASMLKREPWRGRAVAEKVEFEERGSRNVGLGRSRWREGDDDVEDEEEGEEGDAGEGSASGSGAERGRGGYRGGRGRGGGWGGRGRGGRGGGGQGSSGGGGHPPPDSAASRARKEANKGSRANHNRRDGRARKMARGMSGGLP